MVTSVPLRTPTYFVLAALKVEGRLHGYAIVKAADHLSDGTVRLTAGTLYGALDRLEAEGLVAVSGEERVEGRVRRYYELTALGVTVIEAEAARLRHASDVVLRSRPKAPTGRLA